MSGSLAFSCWDSRFRLCVQLCSGCCSSSWVLSTVDDVLMSRSVAATFCGSSDVVSSWSLASSRLERSLAPAGEGVVELADRRPQAR